LVSPRTASRGDADWHAVASVQHTWAMKTPAWIPILVALIGIAGVLWTQWRADKRNDKEWNRQRQHELMQRSRDDAARTFDHRRHAYADFYSALSAMETTAWNYLERGRPAQLPDDWDAEALRKLWHVALYGKPDVYELGNKAWYAALQYGRSADEGSSYWEAQIERTKAALLAAMRQDLDVNEPNAIRLGSVDKGFNLCARPERARVIPLASIPAKRAPRRRIRECIDIHLGKKALRNGAVGPTNTGQRRWLRPSPDRQTSHDDLRPGALGHITKVVDLTGFSNLTLN
jgi:hypothetical protein